MIIMSGWNVIIWGYIPIALMLALALRIIHVSENRRRK